jgi:hypothetical protein
VGVLSACFAPNANVGVATALLLAVEAPKAKPLVEGGLKAKLPKPPNPLAPAAAGAPKPLKAGAAAAVAEASEGLAGDEEPNANPPLALLLANGADTAGLFSVTADVRLGVTLDGDGEGDVTASMPIRSRNGRRMPTPRRSFSMRVRICLLRSTAGLLPPREAEWNSTSAALTAA